jgi:hypothetical protein
LRQNDKARRYSLQKILKVRILKLTPSSFQLSITYNIQEVEETKMVLTKIDTVSTVMGYLFLPTGILQATCTRPSSTHL